MKRIPSNAVACGNKKCSVCSKRRKVYRPFEARERDLFEAVMGISESAPACSECFQQARSKCVRAGVDAVLAKHRATVHAFDRATVVSHGPLIAVVPPKESPKGRYGMSCFVWINGSCMSSENCLDINNGVEDELRAIPGVQTVRINLD